MGASLRAFRAIPKADLHSHIDGSVPARVLFQIARRHGLKIRARSGLELENVSSFMRFLSADGYGSMLDNIVDRFYPITGLMQSEEAIRDVGVAYVGGQKEDGVAYAEGRFAPQYHTREGLSLKEVISSMASGLREGAEKYGVKVGLIAGIGRESTARLGEEVARAASSSGLVAALDLCGPEAGHPPQRFKRAFEMAAASGLKVTVHAGEGAGSMAQNLANIEVAITQLKANRIGHAVNLASDSRLMSMVRDRSVAVEMNPISNVVLRNIRGFGDLRIDRLLSEGVNVSLNSDDPAIWPHGSLSEVYSSVCRSYDFGMKQIDSLVQNSFKGAFASDRDKAWLAELYQHARRRVA